MRLYSMTVFALGAPAHCGLLVRHFIFVMTILIVANN